MAFSFYFIVAALLISLSLPPLQSQFRSRRKAGPFLKGEAPLPPGPKGIPLLGNSLQLPSTRPWEGFAAWADKYGDVLSISAGRRDIIILSSPETVHELLNNRAVKYSDRPVVPMAGHLVGFDQGLTMSQDGKWHKSVRKLMASVLNPSAVKQFQELQDEETAKFLLRISSNPSELRKQIKLFAGSISLRVAYGYSPQQEGDPMLAIATKAVHAISTAGTPGKWLVDVLPGLRYIPYWFPGAGFKRQAKIWRKDLFTFYHHGFEWVESQIQSNKPPPTYLSPILSAGSISSAFRSTLLHSAAAIYGGGTETLSSALATFFLYMSLHPEIQRKAQAEIDSVIGSSNRLPNAGDQPRLPYTEAIMKECLRILPPSPLGVPHAVREKDEYLGYRIPKGAVIYVNIWRILHDPLIYPYPHTFNPERYFEPGDLRERNRRDPTAYVFGSGRRICPGMFLAEATLFQVIAATLATFDILRSPESDGVMPKPTTGAFSHPGDFRCEVKSKGEERLNALRQMLEEGSFKLARKCSEGTDLGRNRMDYFNLDISD